MSFKVLNIAEWPRRNSFEFYKNFDDPYFNATVNVDMTSVYKYCKSNDKSFFLMSIYICLEAANAVENFKMRWHEGGIKVYDLIHGGSTILYDDESFGFAYYTYEKDQDKFLKTSGAIIDKLKANKTFNPSSNNDDLIYFSSLPWFSFTSFKHAQDKSINNSIPRITFGKYIKSDTSILLPINIEVNHAFMDGYHLGLFFQELEKVITHYEN